MRIRLLILCAMTLMAAGWLRADAFLGIPDFIIDLTGGTVPGSTDGTGDPRISIGSGCCSDGVNADTFDLMPSSPLQTFQGGGGIFDLFNNSGDNWFNINFRATFPGLVLNVEEFQCFNQEGGPFAHCDITVNGDTVNILYSGGVGIPTVDPPPGDPQTFTPTTDTVGGWLDDGQPVIIHAQANVPEPSTIMLLLTAAGVLAIRRKLGS